jgi:FKBP-type peptidyl-prolyl cis-trans isomerase FkpA
MRSIIITTAAVLATAGSTFSQDEAKKEEPAPAAQAAPAVTPQNVGYAVGTFFGKQLKQSGLKVDTAEVLKAINDTLEGKEPRFSELQIQQIMNAAQAGAADAQRAERLAEERKAYDKAVADGDKNAVAGRDFLTTNGKRKEVTTTASGLQYEVLTAAEGEKPLASNAVTVHYKGTLLDGTEFDSSYKRNEPTSFPLMNVIGGWTEGLQLMAKGAKYKFYIPGYLAYGSRGEERAGIAPHAMLTFEVELLGIEK